MQPKKYLYLLLIFFLLFMLLSSAVGHIVQPEFYAAMIPPFIPKSLANILAAIVETAVGAALIIPRFRKWGGLGFLLLMCAFMPIHIWDLFRENPAVGSTGAAVFRFGMQIVLIYFGWVVYQKESKKA